MTTPEELRRLAQGLNNRQECEDDAADALRAYADSLEQAEPARIVDIGVSGNGMHLTVEGGPAKLFAECFADQFRQSGAMNYLEMRLTAPDGLELLVTLQKVAGKTPHQLRAEAERERDELKANPSRTEPPKMTEAELTRIESEFFRLNPLAESIDCGLHVVECRDKQWRG